MSQFEVSKLSSKAAVQPSKNASVSHMVKVGSDTRREGKKDRKKAYETMGRHT